MTSLLKCCLHSHKIFLELPFFSTNLQIIFNLWFIEKTLCSHRLFSPEHYTWTFLTPHVYFPVLHHESVEKLLCFNEAINDPSHHTQWCSTDVWAWGLLLNWACQFPDLRKKGFLCFVQKKIIKVNFRDSFHIWGYNLFSCVCCSGSFSRVEVTEAFNIQFNMLLLPAF